MQGYSSSLQPWTYAAFSVYVPWGRRKGVWPGSFCSICFNDMLKIISEDSLPGETSAEMLQPFSGEKTGVVLLPLGMVWNKPCAERGCWARLVVFPMPSSHLVQVKGWSFNTNLAAPSLALPCLEVTLNVFVLVDCTKYFTAKPRLGVQNVFYLSVLSHAHTLLIHFSKLAIASFVSS